MAATAASRPAATRLVIHRLLWQWLAVGALLYLLFPSLRGLSPILGHGALWLLALPASALIAFHREALSNLLNRR
jgi:hypothetical protein